MLGTLAAVKCHAKRDAHARRTMRNACVRALAVCALLTSGAAMEPRAGPDLDDVANVLRSWQAGPSCNELGKLVGGALRMLCNGDQCQLIDMAQGLVAGLACDHRLLRRHRTRMLQVPLFNFQTAQPRNDRDQKTTEIQKPRRC